MSGPVWHSLLPSPSLQVPCELRWDSLRVPASLSTRHSLFCFAVRLSWGFLLRGMLLLLPCVRPEDAELLGMAGPPSLFPSLPPHPCSEGLCAGSSTCPSLGTANLVLAYLLDAGSSSGLPQWTPGVAAGDPESQSCGFSWYCGNVSLMPHTRHLIFSDDSEHW